MGSSFGQFFRITTWGESHGGGVGVVIPGTGVGVGVGPGGAGVVVAPGGNCRTITVQRDDGSVRRIRRCD